MNLFNAGNVINLIINNDKSISTNYNEKTSPETHIVKLKSQTIYI